jgi:hypothetical protein
MGVSLRVRMRVAGAVLPVMALAAPLPTSRVPGSMPPMWSNDPHVYVTGKVRCEGSDTPNWVWLDAENGDDGPADVWSERASAAQFGRHFVNVPQSGTQVSAHWACGYDDDQYVTTFRLTRPWWGRTTTVNLCPWRPCWA